MNSTNSAKNGGQISAYIMLKTGWLQACGWDAAC